MPTSSERSNGAPTIAAKDLSKSYVLGEFSSAIEGIQRTVAKVTGGEPPPRHEPFYALDGVSFEIYPGDCLAVLGENGSGKSTLVQIISGITVPTGGELQLRGRVLPLLEVGSVFHDELTGRENVELFGTVLGLTREEIAAAMPLITEFGGIDEDHMDTPMKRFSTGMRARLSFAVAMRFPADIFIFDEVMAVVDDHFRMVATSEITRLIREGATVIFISHDLDLVRELSNKALWLEKGRIRMLGGIGEVADAYEQAELAGLEG